MQDRRSNKRYARPWIVRWAVDGKSFQRGHRTKVEADHYRSLLLVAQREGQSFDEESGEPTAWSITDSDMPLHHWVRKWLAESWDEWQPRTRASAIEALARFVPLTAPAGAPDRSEMRAKIGPALDPVGTPDPTVEAWMDKWCPRLSDLDRTLLATVDAELGLGVKGQPLGPATAGRFRKVARSCIRRAVELELIDKDPWPPPLRGAKNRKVRKTQSSVDVRSLPDPATMRRALDAMISHQPASHTYRLMTSLLYYAGLRPSEVVLLRPKHFELPDVGWGAIHVTEADISFDEPGTPKTGPRTVPIPPALVKEVDEWIRARSIEPEAHMFRTRTGRRPTASNWRRNWHRGLRNIDHPTLRLYDCRHAAATTWLHAGVPLGEVARRLGHSVEVLVSTYVGALRGDELAANEMIERYLGDVA